jgi:hypothetical protein
VRYSHTEAEPDVESLARACHFHGLANDRCSNSRSRFDEYADQVSVVRGIENGLKWPDGAIQQLGSGGRFEGALVIIHKPFDAGQSTSNQYFITVTEGVNRTV